MRQSEILFLLHIDKEVAPEHSAQFLAYGVNTGLVQCPRRRRRFPVFAYLHLARQRYGNIFSPLLKFAFGIYDTHNILVSRISPAVHIHYSAELILGETVRSVNLTVRVVAKSSGDKEMHRTVFRKRHIPTYGDAHTRLTVSYVCPDIIRYS